MHKSEQEVKEQLEQEGWTVYRNGWPDFAAIKNGMLRFVEVKATGHLSNEQLRMFALLNGLFGIEVEVLRPKVIRAQRKKQTRREYLDKRSAAKRKKRAERMQARLEEKRLATHTDAQQFQ